MIFLRRRRLYHSVLSRSSFFCVKFVEGILKGCGIYRKSLPHLCRYASLLLVFGMSVLTGASLVAPTICADTTSGLNGWMEV